jgi:peptidoglycan-N-acetylglucosamine deacetylase
MERLCSVSIDLDPIPCYYRIHGLGRSPAELRDVVLRSCLPRFADLLASRGIRATFFVVGQDIDRVERGAVADEHRARLAALAEAGHELGNHSYSHPYELARLSSGAIADEIGRCDQLLVEVAGRPTAGFRAPGYDVSAPMLAELMRRGYVYDSSVFPAPGYYAAKAAVMAGLAAVGRPSGAVLTNPRALTAPPDPYRPSASAPWRRGQASVVEMPIAVTPWLRVPAIGTSLLLAPRWLRDHWIAAMGRRSFFNFELHGIDLADAELDGIPGELVARQPDLRVPLEAKVAALAQILDTIAKRFTFVPLREAAAWAHREAA